jgi:hypothetical protein
MLSLNLFTRRGAAILVVAVIVLATAAIPAWCVATGMWW